MPRARYVRRMPLLLVAASLGLCACATDRPPEARSLNELRLLGSHNSYKCAIPPDLLRHIASHDPGRARAIDYSHRSIASQLDSGLRQLEIDVLADAEGGRYLHPLAERYLSDRGRRIGIDDGFDRRALAMPGFKVLHIPDIDVFTHCAALSACLRQIRDWSDGNPRHLPVFILINVKETPAPIDGGVRPVVFGEAEYDALDAAILRAWPEERLLTPGDVVHGGMSLRESVLGPGWPSVEESRGKLIFVFDGNARQTDIYRRGHPSLRGRVMFAAVDPALPEAAIVVANDPVGDGQRIAELVATGFIVRTRADADFDETPAEMRARYEAAVASGAQLISSDFYAGSPNAERSAYSINP